MQIESVYDRPTSLALQESAKSFPREVKDSLVAIHKRVLTHRVDNLGEPLPITKADIVLLEGLIISLEAQLRDRAKLQQLLASSDGAESVNYDGARMYRATEVTRQSAQLPAIRDRLGKVCDAINNAAKNNDHQAYQELRAQAATYLADTLYMHNHGGGGYRDLKYDFPGDTLTTGLKRGTPGRLDIILALSPANFTSDGGYWGVRSTAEDIVATLALLLQNDRLAAVAKDHLMLQPETGYTKEQLQHMLDNARAITAAYKERDTN